MSLRRLQLLALIVAMAGLTGCQARNRDLEQELVDIKNAARLNEMLLERQSEFLTNKVDLVTQQIDKLEEDNHRLSRDFSIYAARPEEVKHEVLTEVDVKTDQATKAQEDFRREFTQKLNQRAADLDAKSREAISDYMDTLNADDRFFRFVFTEQDSLNRIFAARFENRPWYESILGKWESQQQREEEAAALTP